MTRNALNKLSKKQLSAIENYKSKIGRYSPTGSRSDAIYVSSFKDQARAYIKALEDSEIISAVEARALFCYVTV